jgi:hypothetical protein
MKHVIMMSCLVATNAMALDFDTEWAKFKVDFEKISKTAKREVKAVHLPPIEELTPNVVSRVDPKSPDRLGLKLSDASMVERMKKLYAKPDTVVYSLTLSE